MSHGPDDAIRDSKDSKLWSNRVTELEAEVARLKAERDLILAEGRDELNRCAAGWRKANDRLQSECNRLHTAIDDLIKMTWSNNAARFVPGLTKRTMTVPLVAGIVLLSVLLTFAMLYQPMSDAQKTTENRLRGELAQLAMERGRTQGQLQILAQQTQQNQLQAQIARLTAERHRLLNELGVLNSPQRICAYPRQFTEYAP
jgi:hypothetical protein